VMAADYASIFFKIKQDRGLFRRLPGGMRQKKGRV